MLLIPSVTWSADGDENRDLAQRAHTILRAHCYKCHGIKFEVPQFNVMDRESLVAARPNELSFVVPGDAETSLVWQRMGVDLDMPPNKIKERPSDDEIATIKAWIEAGGDFPQTNDRPFITEEQKFLSVPAAVSDNGPPVIHMGWVEILPCLRRR